MSGLDDAVPQIEQNKHNSDHKTHQWTGLDLKAAYRALIQGFVKMKAVEYSNDCSEIPSDIPEISE